MSVNPDIHDKAYQFFIEEAAELLQIIEDGILELRRDRGANTVHAVMRAAHSIKGGAASVELEAIKTIAHRMETAFRALYDETVEIDDELEGLLLDGFDCLKDPLNEQIESGSHDPETALSVAMPVIEALEEKLGADALKQADNYIPSSSDLGIDMVTSIFEIDVEEGIVRLEEIAAHPENFPVLGELQVQAEVFVGFGELLELPGFGAIAQAILDACHNNPADPIGLLNIALQDLQAAKALVMGGDRDQGGAPSEALLALTGGGNGRDAESEAASAGADLSAGDFADFGLSEADLANFDFGAADLGAADLDAVGLGSEGFSGFDIEPSEPLEQPLEPAVESIGELDVELEAEPVIEPITEPVTEPVVEPIEFAELTHDSSDSLADGFSDSFAEVFSGAASAALDSVGLTVEEAVLLDAADASDAPEVDVTDGFELGADDFQALIDESGSLSLADEPSDELTDGETGGREIDCLADLEVDELTNGEEPLADPSENAADFSSLDAMAQLANLMAAPDEDEVATPDSEVGFAADQAEAAIAPEVDLENMWAELSEDMGDRSGEAADSSDGDDLDSAFEIAMDEVDDAQPLDLDAPQEESPEDLLADVFAEESILLPEEQDVTTALSIAEADAAFEAMVDASATSQDDDAAFDAEASLGLDFDAELPSFAPESQDELEAQDEPEIQNELEAQDNSEVQDELEAQDNSEVQNLFALELPDEEVSLEERSPKDLLDEAASESTQAGLLDPWSSLAAETMAAETIEAQAEEETEQGLEKKSETTFEDALAEVGLPELAEATEEPAEEWSEEGTFVQGLDMGTYVQADPIETAEPSDKPSAEASKPDLPEAFEVGTVIQAFDEGTFIQDVAVESAEPADQEQSSGSEDRCDEGTYVQGYEDGTFIQGLSDDAGDTATPAEVASAQAKAAEMEQPATAAEDGDEWRPAAEAEKADEPLIPELQAFIAQAAAESAGSVAGAEGVVTTDAGAELNATAEVVQPEAPEFEISAPEAAESEIGLEPEAAATEDISGLEILASQGSEPDSLPSLDTMFSVDPEQLAAIASDSLTSELITSSAADLEPAAALPSEASESELLEIDSEAFDLVDCATDSASGETLDAIATHVATPDEAAPSEATAGETSTPDELPSDEAAPEDAEQTEAPTLTPVAVEVALAEHQLVEPDAVLNEVSQAKADRINDAVSAAEQLFNQLPIRSQAENGQAENSLAENSQVSATPAGTDSAKADLAPASQTNPATELTGEQPRTEPKETAKPAKKKRQQGGKLSGISVRVDLSVLERMNNLVGELVLSRNSLSMQHEQLQSVVTQLDKRFTNFEGQLSGLRGLSDQMLVEPAQRRASGAAPQTSLATPNVHSEGDALLEGFDVLEMDRYSALHGQLQEIFEQLMQLEEGVDDIGVLLEQSTQSLTQQRQRLGLLQNELMWARMLPLDNILGRFPRVLRDMARKHSKSVDLNMNGTSVLVDKGMLEKLHDPMLHLLRNAFDHGIELPEERQSQGKSERGEIQINAYYQGNQTVIEIKDDGQGINLERIAKRAIELQWLSRDEIKSIPQQALLDLIFEPGFSTAARLSELSGRGVGLDVVREQIKGLKGNVTVDFEPGVGTTFTLRLPLTLTVAKLMVCQIETTAIAIPSDGIEDLLVPQPEQLKTVGDKRLLHWRDELIPIQSMADLLDYNCPTADIASLKSITAKSIPVPKDWALPLLIFSRGSQRCAMEVNRLLMEQELVIKPFSSAMTPPEYSYGCTILGDGRMVPVLDGTALLQRLSNNSVALAAGVDLSDDALEGEAGDGAETAATMAQAMQAETLLVVDDSTAMRRTMALSLEKAGYRVLQAGDGQEALTQLRQSSAVQLVICDVEMPNMNGFEFLSQRRREPVLMKIPVVMLTSRSSDKHRRLAMQLKAHDYFSKPYVEQDFLKSIKQILKTQQGAVAKV